MGCFSKGSKEQKDEAGSTSANNDEFDGPTGKRSCTDIPMLLFFIAFFIGMGYVAIEGFRIGDPYRLFYGVDSWGNICNRKNPAIENVSHSGQDTTGLMYRYYFNPSTLTDPTQQSTVICTKSCPLESISDVQELEEFHHSSGASLCRYDVNPMNVRNAPAGACPPFTISQTTPVFSFCVPQLVSTVGDVAVDAASNVAQETAADLGVTVLAQCNNLGSFFEVIMSDTKTTWRYIIYLSLASIGIASIFTVLMRFFAAILIWFSVLLCVSVFLGAAIFSWISWFMLKQSLSANPDSFLTMNTTHLPENIALSLNQWFYLSIVTSVIAVIVFLVLLVMRKRIMLVVQLFREASKAVAAMPFLLLQPLWTLIALATFLSILLVVFSYIITAVGDASVQGIGQVEFESDTLLTYSKWYYVFGIIWIVEFIFGCQQFVIAGAVATWYFSRNKQLGSPIIASTKRLVRYHMGSIAFGSMLIAIIQLFRVMLTYAQSRVCGKANATRYVMRCLQCCLWCLKKLMSFVNKNAYIMTAIYGTNFCVSTKKALQVIVGNVVRVSAISSVGGFCLFLGKMSISAISIGLGLVLFKNVDGLCYIYVPTLIVGLFAFLVGHCFLNVYSMVVDTIFLSFCVDCDMNDGINRPYFMSKYLMKYVDNENEALAALRAREKAGDPQSSNMS